MTDKATFIYYDYIGQQEVIGLADVNKFLTKTGKPKVGTNWIYKNEHLRNAYGVMEIMASKRSRKKPWSGRTQLYFWCQRLGAFKSIYQDAFLELVTPVNILNK